MKFYIPSYQRGYRWTDNEVKDLLYDIKDFAEKKRREYEFYCVQPLVVKEMSHDEKISADISTDNTWYEVIDGQQRLTTIKLILEYLEACNLPKFPGSLYELKYERGEDNIDVFFVKKARKTIAEWFAKEDEIEYDIFNALVKSQFDEGDPPRDKSNNIRFIWYESDENPIKVFTRLNVGKIPLTNSELIKALILNRSNFSAEDLSRLQLRQQEIASEWDNIEYTLQKEEFWLFIHKIGYTNPTRIDYIFDLIFERNALKLSEEQLKACGNDNDKDRTFRYFYEYFKRRNASITYCWSVVKSYFHILKEWYEDLYLYHYVGYLVDCQETDAIGGLIEKWELNQDKNSFLESLKSDIKEILDQCPDLDYQYRVDGSNKRKCKPILLFHNIQTVINQNSNLERNAKYNSVTFYKFPFHLYKLENWHVEHINSNTTNVEEDENTQDEWMINMYLAAGEDVQNRIKIYFDSKIETKKKIFEEVKSLFPENESWSAEEKNRIWNYALLDSNTNQSYGNAIFSGKRRVLIGKERGIKISIPRLYDGKIIFSEEKKDITPFVPICTKQVFLKYYSPAVGNSNYWEKRTDAVFYLRDIKECIEKLDAKNGK